MYRVIVGVAAVVALLGVADAWRRKRTGPHRELTWRAQSTLFAGLAVLWGAQALGGGWRWLAILGLPLLVVSFLNQRRLSRILNEEALARGRAKHGGQTPPAVESRGG